MNSRQFQTVSEFLDFFRTRLNERFRRPLGALASVALVHESESLHVCGKVVFSDERLQPRPPSKYDQVTLIEEWVAGGHALRRLPALLRGEGHVCGVRLPPPADRQRSVQVQWQLGRSYSARHHSTALIARLHGDHLQGGQQGPLLQLGLRPYDNIYAAVNHWVHGRLQSSSVIDDGWTIVLPDSRARIAEARWRLGELHLSIESAVPRRQLEVQVLFGQHGALGWQPVRSPRPELSLKPPEDADEATVLLLHRDGALLDEIELTPSQPFFDAGGPDPIYEHAELELCEGEGERVEYKEWITPSDKKQHELVETTIAFLNRDGGRIYLGVDDHGRIQGWPPLQKTRRGKKKEVVLQETVEWARKFIVDQVKPDAPVRVVALSTRDEPIVVVDVPRGRNTPYASRENQVFIRKGSNNFIADPETEMPRLYEASGRGGFAGPFSRFDSV